jgi:ribose transport system ATP-binding protein
VASLGVGRQQLVEIAAALDRRCALLVLDEPTAALTPEETERLLAEIERLKASGTALLFISHRLEEVERVAERISVLRDGERVATRGRGELARDEMVRLMIGRPLEALPVRQTATPGDTALSVESLSGDGFHGVELSVRRGEIVGLAGLMGAGRTELLRGIFGAEPARGAVRVGDARPRRPFASPREAVRAGLALVPEDRKAQGLLLPFPVRANVTLTRLGAFADRAGRISETRESEAVRPLTEALGLRARSLEQPVAQLSGGNQQKVLLARWLLEDSDVLLVDEPTRGIDVGARSEVHRLLLDLAARGKAVVVASSELDELFALCDRILVLCAGRIAAELARGHWSADAVLRAALGTPAPGGAA